MAVALLGRHDDPQVTTVRSALDDRNTETHVWDATQWPGETPLSFAQRADGENMVVDTPVDVETLDAVYFRQIDLDPRTGELGADFEDRPHAVMNQVREYRGLLLSLLESLEQQGVSVVNPASTMRIHGHKPYQLSVFADAGLPVPETLTTNDPSAVESFVDAVGAAIYKPVGGGGHARTVDDATLSADRLERLANAPVQFQERLDGDTLRLFVAGDTVVAGGRIHSDELDYRLAEHEVEPYEPDPEIADAAVRATKALGLRFSGVDIIAEADRFALLEANPSPMFATFDEVAGTDVAGQLADYLSSFA